MQFSPWYRKTNAETGGKIVECAEAKTNNEKIIIRKHFLSRLEACASACKHVSRTHLPRGGYGLTYVHKIDGGTGACKSYTAEGQREKDCEQAKSVSKKYINVRYFASF